MAVRAAGRHAPLIVGPWTHLDLLDPIGERCFGLEAMREAPVHPHGDWADEVLAFLAHHLAGAGATDDGPAVRLFVMGRNAWPDEERWPLSRAESQHWNLHADGTLSPASCLNSGGFSELMHDPAHPVPTRGGGHLLASHPRGPVDQAHVEARDDVLVFTSRVLTEDLESTGRVRAILHVESDAPSADWVVRLCDVGPDGRSLNVCDGISRINAQPGGVQRVEVDLWSTSNVFLAGHRLRVQVTNSCFPRWDRNLGTGDQHTATFVATRQRLHHQAERPSCIELPAIAT
jgi:putative CocE/NonD family hydrolase